MGKIFKSLSKDQKEAVGLLQIGTFLEYFDLMLYVHMAVLLNDLFFPKTDPHTAALISAFAFCSTYVLRPVGAIIFGYIGDNIGRKATVVITTMMMSTSCIIMANLPTYAQIGITAAWAVTICRVVQGISSMGEIIGAEIYLTEITKPPASYPIVSLIGCSSRLGTMFALGVTTLVLTWNLEWRTAFWIGAGIAVVGSLARTRLRETPEFVDMKKQIKNTLNISDLNSNHELKVSLNTSCRTNASYKTILAYFFISSGPPACLYFSYIYFGNILKNHGFNNEFIVKQNFILSIVEFLAIVAVTYVSVRFNPLRILKIRSLFYLVFILLFPLIIIISSDPEIIFIIQMISVVFTLTGVPAVPILINHFPVMNRFTYTSFIYASSRAVVYIVTSFGLVYLTGVLGHIGACFILGPITLGFLWGTVHFEKLEQGVKKNNLNLGNWIGESTNVSG